MDPSACCLCFSRPLKWIDATDGAGTESRVALGGSSARPLGLVGHMRPRRRGRAICEREAGPPRTPRNSPVRPPWLCACGRGGCIAKLHPGSHAGHKTQRTRARRGGIVTNGLNVQPPGAARRAAVQIARRGDCDSSGLHERNRPRVDVIASQERNSSVHCVFESFVFACGFSLYGFASASCA